MTGLAVLIAGGGPTGLMLAGELALAGVDVALSDGQSRRAQYLVGCDGGRSLIRKAAGIEFPGWDPTTSNIIAEVELAQEPPEWGINNEPMFDRSRFSFALNILFPLLDQLVDRVREGTLDPGAVVGLDREVPARGCQVLDHHARHALVRQRYGVRVAAG